MEFNNPVTKSTVVSTAFTASDGNTYTLVDDGLGIIKLARSTYTTSGVTVDNPTVYMTLTDGSENQGTIDYTTGKVELNNFNPYTISDSSSSIRFTITPETNNQDITPLREQILTTDINDSTAIVINMVAETIIKYGK